MRLRTLLVCCGVIALSLGVAAAYGALGGQDTATGTGALASESGGDFNTADGFGALNANTTGSYNTAAGQAALHDNTTADANTGVGDEALRYNTTGAANTAAGAEALFSNISGSWNTAASAAALHNNTTGDANTAAGESALAHNTTGSQNTAIGMVAGGGLHGNTTGSYNTFLGFAAAPGTDAEIDNATAVGANAVVDQSDSLVLGAPGVNVGINTPTPDSRLQIGRGATSSWGEYLQLPVVNSTAKTPPASDCNSTIFVGRVVVQKSTKKMILWGCSPTGLWVKL